MAETNVVANENNGSIVWLLGGLFAKNVTLVNGGDSGVPWVAAVQRPTVKNSKIKV